MFNVDYENIFSIEGLLFSVIGALVILVIYGFVTKRKAV